MSTQPTMTRERRREFRDRVRSWAQRMKVEPKQIQVRRMSQKWASCSSARYVCFSEALLQKPLVFQDYVIVHELLHLRVPNHGKLFKSLLSAYLPGWRDSIENERASAEPR
jgi:predicted metal-dependent hydrolase